MAQQTVVPLTDRERRLTMTYAEFLARADEGGQAEWVNGEAIVFMPPSIRHQELVGFLYGLLSVFIRRLNLGKILFAPCEMRATPEGPAREPDLFFVEREHLDWLDDRRLAGPADVVIEVICESSLTRDRVEKFYEYQKAGVREYWMVDPLSGHERLDLWRLNAEGKYEPIAPDAEGRYHSSVLPGFWLHRDWLWQDPLPDPLELLAAITPLVSRDPAPPTAADPA